MARPLRRVALLGPYGFGNLGDAAIQEAAIAAIRARHPGAEIHGISLNPPDTEARHGIVAHPLHPAAPSLPTRPAAAASLRGMGKRAASRLPALAPAARLAREVLGRVERAAREARFWRDARRLVGTFDLLIISGGGQLDDSWGGPWRHPFALFRWGSLARMAGTPVVSLSLGAGPIHRRLSRFFFRRALGVARYRSYRDAESRALARALEIGDGPVVPDLAWGLLPPTGAPGGDVVGLSPMALFDPRAWPERDADAYRAYLDAFAALAGGLLADGHTVELFATNVRMDQPVLDDLESRLGGRVSRCTASTVDGLLRRLASYRLIVTSRYHGVLLAHLSGTPAVALAHHPKLRSLMAAAGQEGACLEARGFSPDDAWRRVRTLDQRRVEVAARLRAHAAACRQAVESQFDLVLGARPAPGPSPAPLAVVAG